MDAHIIFIITKTCRAECIVCKLHDKIPSTWALDHNCMIIEGCQ